MESPFRSIPAVALALAACAAAQEPAKPIPAQPAQPGRAAQPAQRAMRLSPAPRAREKSQSDLIKLRAKKLSKKVFENADWFYDYDEARAAAKAEDKLLLVYFTRSYAP